MKTTNHLMVAIVAGVLVLGVCCVRAQDWPQWRGPDGAAKATSFKAPKVWPKELAQKWKVTVGEGVATPALVGDKLYVISRQEGNEITRCLDAATGKEIWQEKYESLGASGAAASFSGPRSSPAVANGKVVTVGVRGMISCLDAKTGVKIWRKNDFEGVPRFFVSSSPIITDGLCIAHLGGGNSGVMVAYDLASGDEKWKWTGESPGYASPALMTVDGSKLVVALTEKRFVALAVADGKLVWETPFAAQGMGGYNASSAVIDGQTIIYSGGSRGTKAVKIEKEGDAFKAKELWSNADKSVQFNTPVLKDGYLYGLTSGNEFFCLNAKTGEAAWTAPAAPPANREAAVAGGGDGAGAGAGAGGGRRGGRGGGRGGGYGSVVDAGSVLLALTPSSELIAFQPSEKAYTEVARIKVAESQTHAYPVISGNRVFIKDKESVSLLVVE